MTEPSALSLVKGPPLAGEPGLGTLTLPGFLHDVTTRFAAREALVFHDGGGVTRWSYAELWDRAFEIARALAALGVGKDTRVGVLMTNRPEWVAAAFGVGLAGGVLVGVSTFSTVPELEYLLKSSAVSVLLFERKVGKKDFLDMLTTLEPAIARAAPGRLKSETFPFLEHLAAVDVKAASGAVETWGDFLRHGEAVPPSLIEARRQSVKPADTGVLFFSSGSTATPKGILSAHRGVAIQCWRMGRLFGLKEDTRCWMANAFFWSGNFATAMGATLSVGGSLVLQTMFDPVAALDLMQKERVTYPVAWPHQWAQLEAAPNWSSVDLSSLIYVDAKHPIGRHPTVKTAWTECNAYGNTETFTFTTAFVAGTPVALTDTCNGEVLPGCIIKIVDPVTGEIVPFGARGEIAVKGPTLMLGYVGIPASETFDDEGFFATGDGGYFDEEKRLVWEGRLSDIIKTGGANVSPVEIDTVAKDCPGVKIVKTVGVPHPTLGELVVSCVVPHDDATLTEVIVRDYLKERLAAYKVPRRVLFFREEDLSLTGSAKVKAGSLKELAAERLG